MDGRTQAPTFPPVPPSSTERYAEYFTGLEPAQPNSRHFLPGEPTERNQVPVGFGLIRQQGGTPRLVAPSIRFGDTATETRQKNTGNDTHNTRPTTAPILKSLSKVQLRGFVGQEGDAQDDEQHDGRDEAARRGEGKHRSLERVLRLKSMLQVIRSSPRMPTKNTYCTHAQR